jgi:hypothetical protein
MRIMAGRSAHNPPKFVEVSQVSSVISQRELLS